MERCRDHLLIFLCRLFNSNSYLGYSKSVWCIPQAVSGDDAQLSWCQHGTSTDSANTPRVLYPNGTWAWVGWVQALLSMINIASEGWQINHQSRSQYCMDDSGQIIGKKEWLYPRSIHWNRDLENIVQANYDFLYAEACVEYNGSVWVKRSNLLPYAIMASVHPTHL